MSQPRKPQIVISQDELNDLREEARVGKAAVKELLRQPVAFHRAFRTITGSITAALMLSQAYYWSDKSGKDSDGWFWKTQEEWESETGLSRNEQENARKILKIKGFMSEQRKGAPAKLFFKVDMDRIFKSLGGSSQPSMALTSILECDSMTGKNARDSQSLYIAETTTEITSETTAPNFKEGFSLVSDKPKEHKSSKADSKKNCDPRCAAVTAKIFEAYKHFNQVNPGWGAIEGNLLKLFLASHLDWTEEKIFDCIRNRFKSEINPAEEPRKWISSIGNYASGPLDQYGKPKSNGNGYQNGTQSRTNGSGQAGHLLDHLPSLEENQRRQREGDERLARKRAERGM